MHNFGKSEVETTSQKISEGVADNADKMPLFLTKIADAINKTSICDVTIDAPWKCPYFAEHQYFTYFCRYIL